MFFLLYAGGAAEIHKLRIALLYTFMSGTISDEPEVRWGSSFRETPGVVCPLARKENIVAEMTGTKKRVRFGIIGTNSISHTFMEAAKEVPEFHLTAVYSRAMETGMEFAKTYGISQVYTSLDELAASDLVDAVYIASPNSLHFPQGMQMMEHGKHVLCEKPGSADCRQMEQLIACAGENQVIFLEAMRPVFDPGFAKIEELLPRLGTIRRADFQYCQYSSRYDKFKQGTVMNAFNPELANAALMDIGVYCVHPMVRLFGMPESVLAGSIFLDNGMEGTGTVIANYGTMQAVLQYSKISNSCLPSQIQGEEGSMVVREISDTREISLYLRGGGQETYVIDKMENNMFYEIQTFCRLVRQTGDASVYNQCSLMEMKVMDEVRRQAGIVFASRKM